MNDIKLYTFDVFDTIITRSTAFPSGVFAIMQEKLCESDYNDIPEYIRSNFINLRVNSERLSWQSNRSKMTLRDIYQCMMHSASLLVSQLERLIILEKKIEYLCSCPIEKNINIIREHKKNKKNIAFVSDMYLDSVFISSLIQKHAPDLSDVPIYVSCEYGVGKIDGLFGIVLDKENVNAKQTTHFGDNIEADIKGAKKYGIMGTLYEFEKLTDWEEKVLSKMSDSAFVHLAIGSARNLRINNNLSESGILGSSFTAPILLPYVAHVLNRCIEKNIEMVLFIARDGIVLNEIASTLLETEYGNKYSKIITKVIYASRTVWYTEKQAELELAAKYLMQELNNNGSRFANYVLVDLNGRGKGVSQLSRVLNKYIKSQVEVFFMHSLNINEFSEGYVRNLFLSYGTDFIEVLCRAPVGKTIGYRQDNETITPITDEYDCLYNCFNFEDYIYGIKLFINEFINVCNSLSINTERLLLCDFYLKYVLTEEQNKIIKFFGEFFFTSAYDQNDNCKYAVRPSKGEIRKMYLLRDKQHNPFDYCKSVQRNMVPLLYTNKDKQMISFYEKHYNSLLGRFFRFILPKPKPVIYSRLFYELEKNNYKRIIIYGYGIIGKRLVSILKQQGYLILFAVDQNYININDAKSPESILQTNYDVIVVTVSSPAKWGEINDYLKGIGVNKEKIIFYEN